MPIIEEYGEAEYACIDKLELLTCLLKAEQGI